MSRWLMRAGNCRKKNFATQMNTTTTTRNQENARYSFDETNWKYFREFVSVFSFAKLYSNDRAALVYVRSRARARVQ